MIVDSKPLPIEVNSCTIDLYFPVEAKKKNLQSYSCCMDFEFIALIRFEVTFDDHQEKFPNLPVSLASELHNYSTRSASSKQVVIPSFRTNLKRFCPSIIGSFYWNYFPQFIRDKPSKKMFRKAVLRWYLAQY